MNYEAYIASSQWKAKRLERLEIDAHACRLCGSVESLEVHHKPASYSRIPHESVEHDLTTVCRICHNAITDRIRRERYSFRDVPASVLSQPERIVIYDHSANFDEMEGNQPLDYAQRIACRPIEQPRESIEENQLQAKQNGRRP